MKKGTLLIGFIVLTGALLYGIAHLFAARFSLGDIYEPYSSLRADGLGTKALHDSLEELMPVERNLQPLSKLSPDPTATFFVIGAPFDTLSTDRDIEDLQILLHGGERVVLAFYPSAEKEPVRERKRRAAAEDDEADDETSPSVSADWRKLWGISAGFFRIPSTEASAQEEKLEPKVSWHTALHFEKLEPDWRTLYAVGDKPVIVERQVGRGTLVLMADSYLLSNEALDKERAPLLLSALVGGGRHAIFDEKHLGMSIQPGMATLVRQYRLHGIVAALMAVLALFVWRSVVPLVPPGAEQEDEEGVVQGRDATSGFVSMLRRSIARKDLIRTCVNEWRRSNSRIKPEILAKVEAMAEDSTKSPVDIFQTITQTLNQKR